MVLLICARYNSGRRATVRVTDNDYVNIDITIDNAPRHPYDLVLDGYLHLDPESQASWDRVELTIHPDYAEQLQRAIREININYFAGTLRIKSSSTEIADVYLPRRRTRRQFFTELAACFRTDGGWGDLELLFGTPPTPLSTRNLRLIANNLRRALRPQTTRYSIVRPLSEAHLGGTWQIDNDSSWLAEAERRKGAKVFLA